MSDQKANNTIGKVRQLQGKLYLAAKLYSKRKFHALYDKVYRKDILLEAREKVRANRGAGGIDRISIADIESYGVDQFLQEIQQELLEGKYRQNYHVLKRSILSTVPVKVGDLLNKINL